MSAVLFDLYGTLVDITIDEEQASLWRELADWCAINFSYNASAEQLHQDYIRLCREKKKTSGEDSILPDVFRELLGGNKNKEQVRSFAFEFRRLSTLSFEIRPYTIPLLTRLREEQLRLAVVSNTEGILTEYDIGRIQLGSFLDAIVLSSYAGVAKPDPAILDKALRSISARSQNAVFVGDTLETDLAVARALDMPCVLISRFPERLAAYAGYSVRPVLPVFQDIYDAIKELLNDPRLKLGVFFLP